MVVKKYIPDSIFLWVQRVSQWGLAGTAYYWFAKTYDYVLYTFIIVTFGPLKGGAIMLVLSFLLDYGSIILYSKWGKDVFGIESVKKIKEWKHQKELSTTDINLKSKLKKILAIIMRIGDPFVFVVASVVSNPFFVTAYFKNHKEVHLTRRDWTIFLASFFVSNAVWILTIHFSFEFIKDLFN